MCAQTWTCEEGTNRSNIVVCMYVHMQYAYMYVYIYIYTHTHTCEYGFKDTNENKIVTEVENIYLCTHARVRVILRR
jgi:hypothetical protein